MPRRTLEDIKLEQREALASLKLLQLSDVCERLGGTFEPASAGTGRWLFGPAGSRSHRIEVDDARSLWRCAQTSCGGKGPIDLVMLVESCDFKDAVKRLNSDRAGISTISPRPSSPIAPKVLVLPERVDDVWHVARRFLLQERGLAPHLIDREFAKKNIYAARSGPAGRFVNVVMLMRDGAGRVVGAELKGTIRGKAGYFTGLAVGSDKQAGAFHVGAAPCNAERAILVEAGIDALAALQYFETLAPTLRLTAISSAGAGNGFERIEQRLAAGCEKWAGQDSDPAGEAMAAKVSARFDVRWPSPVGKDWGDWAIKQYRDQQKFHER